MAVSVAVRRRGGMNDIAFCVCVVPTGARFKVKPEWYPSLKEAIEELESLKGFGPRMARSVAIDVISECIKAENAGDPDADAEKDADSFDLSYEWTR